MSGWFTTSDQATALMGGYIGEVTIIPMRIASEVRKALFGNPLTSVHMYYYGEPDARLRKLFGYPEVEIESNVASR